MKALLGKIAFRVGSLEYRWDDVLLAAYAWDWAKLRADLRGRSRAPVTPRRRAGWPQQRK